MLTERERWGWKGWMVVRRFLHEPWCAEVNEVGPCDCEVRQVSVARKSNLIVDSGRNFVRDGLRGFVLSNQITYVALGDNSTAVAGSQTRLVDEIFRKQPVKYAAGVTGESVTTAYIAPAEANFTIQEVGWFGFPATGTANSGAMISRLLWAHTKTNLEALQLEHHDLF